MVFIREIQDIDNLYIVTNGLITAIESGKQPSWHVNLIGGHLNSTLQNINGNEAVANIKHYQADLAVLSCRGLTVKGATDANDNESLLKQAFVDNADTVALLVDATKVGKHQLYVSASMQDLDYIGTDKSLPDEIIASAQSHQVKLL